MPTAAGKGGSNGTAGTREVGGHKASHPRPAGLHPPAGPAAAGQQRAAHKRLTGLGAGLQREGHEEEPKVQSHTHAQRAMVPPSPGSPAPIVRVEAAIALSYAPSKPHAVTRLLTAPFPPSISYTACVRHFRSTYCAPRQKQASLTEFWRQMVLPSAVSFTIPFPRPKERGGRRGPAKPQQEGGRRKQAAAARRGALPPAPKPAKPAKPWDFTITDQNQHRLSEAEMVRGRERGDGKEQWETNAGLTAPPPPPPAQAFRRSLRQSRHRLRPAAERQPQQSQDAEAPWEAEGALALEGVPGADVVNFEMAAAQHPPFGYASDGGQSDALASEGEASDGASEAASLSGMQAFVAQLQRKYDLSGVLPPPAGAVAPTSRAQRKLAELRAAAAAAAAAEGSASGGSESDDSNGLEQQLYELCEAAAARRHHTMPDVAAPAAAAEVAPEGDSDSEGGGHLGPAAVRRAQRRQVPAASEAAAAHGLEAYQQQRHQPHAQQVQQQALLDRLVAAEAQLAGTRATVAELQEQNGQLRTGGWLQAGTARQKLSTCSTSQQVAGHLQALHNGFLP